MNNDVAWAAVTLSLLSCLLFVILTLITPDLPDNLEDRVEYLECVHRTFEDGSTVHEDAEVVVRFCPEKPTP